MGSARLFSLCFAARAVRGSVSDRAQMVLWRAEGCSVADIVKVSGTTKPTVYKWLDRYEQFGIDG
ncbi:MAG TPA: helix-turn-helix domain-containing protein, partial [Nitrospiraceae bacterium]|nr:helix-turn-helix domain-containing protein [Nitrospiraceae bacterium]